MPTTDGAFGRQPDDVDRFFELALDLMAIMTPDGYFERLSASWETALGLSLDELRTRHMVELIHPDDVDRTLDALRDLLDGIPVTSFENRYRRADGTYRTLEWTSHRAAGGGRVYGIARDVTAARRRERNQEALAATWLAVASPVELEDILQVGVDQARALVGAEQGLVSLAPAHRGDRGVSAVSVAEKYAATRPRAAAPTGEGMAAEVCRDNVVMRLTQADLEAHPAWQGFRPDLDVHQPMRGWLAVPLVAADGANLGLIELSDKADGTDFDAEDERVLVEFARIASVTVERARAEQAALAERTRAEMLLESIGDAFLSIDGLGRCTYVNGGAARLLRRDRAELLGRTFWREFPAAAGTRFEREFRHAARTGRPVAFVEYYAPHDEWYDVRVYPSDEGLSVFFVDATERIAATRELGARISQQQAVADIGQAALSGVPLQELLDRVTRQVARVLGVTAAWILEPGDDPAEMRVRSTFPRQADPRMARVPGTTFSEALRTGDLHVIDDYATAGLEAQDLARRTGVRSGATAPIGPPSAPWAVLTVTSHEPEAFDERDVLFIRQVAHLLATAMERQRTEERVRHQAEHDALTGLPNRALLHDRLEEAVERAVLGDSCAALLLLDLDGFKDVNDSLGHSVGDGVLQQVAARLKTLAADRHVVGRLGGDEFAICVAGCPETADALDVAEAVRTALHEPFALPELDVALSASVGVAIAPAHGSDGSTLMRHADVAMYRAKANGNAVVLYDPAVDAARTERLTLVADLRAAIEHGQLEVHYQPVVDLTTGAPVSLEALVRWRSASRGMVGPDQFIPLAEQAGLIGPLTEAVVEQVSTTGRELRADGRALRIAVNLSVVALLDAEVAARLVDRLIAERDGMSVEITESSLANRRATAFVDRLARAGVSCAIDDFGTGWSSMASLKAMPVRQLKIDREFVAGLHDADHDVAIVKSVVDLGRALTLEVVAEGVETAEAADRLRDAGVPFGQGYLFARPMPRDRLDDWLAAA